jgi:hypothetical protein
MSRVTGRKKNESKRTPDPDLAPDAPCWCGSGLRYAQCHQLYDRIYSVPKGRASGAVCPT